MKKVKHEGDLKKRLAEREERATRLQESLKTSTECIQHRIAKAEAESTVERISNNLCQLYGHKTIRDIKTFNRSLKSKDPGKIKLAVATHLFGRYKVPAFMQSCWYSETVTRTSRIRDGDWWQRRTHQVQETTLVASPEIQMRRDWFITQATGGSLFKEHAKGILTKAEVHAFLNCPLPSCDFREAIIYALASQWTKDIGIISRIAKSKLNTLVGVNWITMRTMWREVIHFFAVNDLTFQQMNDLFDYFQHVDAQAAGRQEQYSLKGRNLHSLSRQMQDWHYELARVKRMGNAQWEGIPIADAEFELNTQPGNKWFFEQVKSSKALAAEGTAMHHCVYSYQSKCINGTSSIWSVKRLQRKKSIAPERALTLEIDEDARIIQIRGFANRRARPEETEALRYWARQNYLSFSQWA